MVIIVNTTDNTDLTAKISKALGEKNTEFEIIEAASMKISHCVGCNYCWLKTPGVCAIKDDYEIVLKKMITSDQVWVISDTALGFINSKGKNVFDRILPLLIMYLKFENKKMRHISRYDRKKDIGLIYCGEADREFLTRWNERVAHNMSSSPLGAYPEESYEEAISCML